jgi:hypothetical protein
MLRGGVRQAVLSAVAIASLALPALAETRRVKAEQHPYAASGWKRYWFGDGHRDVWSAEFEVEVLDLKTFAGGLTPVRQVGSFQSIGLAMKGADGKSYTFRTLDKDPTRILPEEWRRSVPADIFQDQTSASHPGGPGIATALAEAAGVPHTSPSFVFMPDDPALGEFRATFGGQPGTIDEYPLPAADGSEGFMGAVEIVSMGKLWERWLEGEAAVDTKALLQARIFDLFLGDWDRHNGQWRWMKRAGHAAYEPLPEDRDQAFANYSGVAVGLARTMFPRLVEWRTDYKNLPGLLFQGREVDGWLLAGVERGDYEAVGKDVQARLSDGAIEAAVKRLPPEWYAVSGEALVRDLKLRRARLPQAVAAFYATVAKWVDVQGTNRDDAVRLTRATDGGLEVELSVIGADGQQSAPYFRRRFVKGETREVRIYLYDGDDRLVSKGPRGDIKVRVAVGKGRERLDDSESGGTRFYDIEDEGEVVRGPGTKASGREWVRVPYKKDTPWMERRDFGSMNAWQVLAWWEPDPELVLRVGLTHYVYGFRKQPYSQAHTPVVEWKTGRSAVKVAYDGEFRWSKPDFRSLIEVWADGAKNYGFYGFGNQTTFDQPKTYYEADQEVFYAFPAPVSFENQRRTLAFSLGPSLKYSRNKAADDTLIAQQQPYGFEDFGQLGARVKIEADSRGRRLLRASALREARPRGETGVRLEANGYYYAKAWDVQSAFGAVEGFLAGYWEPKRWLIFAGRAGGRSVWGEYPWGESAFIGGKDSVPGYRRNRFAGDKSFFANGEVRYEVGRLGLVLPTRFGLFGHVGTGRVWLEGESSKKWHPGVGGGLFLRLVTIDAIGYAAIAKGQDGGLRFYVDYGFMF